MPATMIEDLRNQAMRAIEQQRAVSLTPSQLLDLCALAEVALEKAESDDAD